MTTGEKIAKCRKQKGMTQEQLAEILNVTRQAVSRWEGDLAFPETDNLTRLCKLFGVSCDWLLNYDGAEEGKEQCEEQGEATATARFVLDLKKLHLEYISKTHIGKLPLVHVNLGFGRVAKGFFSFGIVSCGVVSFGLVSVGIIAFGILCLGLLSFASVSCGIVALGGAAIGCIALGGLAVGMFSIGGCAVGLFAFGGYASGSLVAIGDVAVGGIAIGDSVARGSVISVLKSEFAAMQDVVYRKFDQLPEIWSIFTSWSKGLAEFFIKT